MKRTLISGNNFARISNVVFSEEIDQIQYKNFDKSNHFIMHSDRRKVSYINTKFVLSENDVIFCKTDYLPLLFQALKKINLLKNIKIISTQSDIKITNQLLKKKPKCVSEWYAVNTYIENKFIKSIPLGIANNFSDKNLKEEDLQNTELFFKNLEEQSLIYSNFNENTNFFIRSKLKKQVSQNKHFVISKSNKNIEEYKNDLQKYNFVFCPPGNGPDTHRIWESLYSGSIPVILAKYSLPYLKYIPHLEINSIQDFNSDFNPRIENLLNLDPLFIEWWVDLINQNKIINNSQIHVFIKQRKISSFKLSFYIHAKFKQIRKRIYTIVYKIIKKIRSNVYKKN